MAVSCVCGGTIGIFGNNSEGSTGAILGLLVSRSLSFSSCSTSTCSGPHVSTCSSVLPVILSNLASLALSVRLMAVDSLSIMLVLSGGCCRVRLGIGLALLE